MKNFILFLAIVCTLYCQALAADLSGGANMNINGTDSVYNGTQTTLNRVIVPDTSAIFGKLQNNFDPGKIKTGQVIFFPSRDLNASMENINKKSNVNAQSLIIEQEINRYNINQDVIIKDNRSKKETPEL